MLVDVQLSGAPVVVDDLDDGFVLQLLEESEVASRQAELRKLRLATQIARLTHGLSKDAAAWVDAQLAPVAATAGPARIQRLVDEAIARFDPEQQAQLEDTARAAWDVRLEHYSGTVWAGTSRLEV